MTTGSSADIQSRILQVLPKRWFKWVAPYRDAIIGSASDGAAWCYSLVQYAKAQTRLRTAYGVWLDIYCYDFLGRTLTRNGAQDNAFRAMIKATILQERVTRNGMVNALTTLTGKAPKIFEPWNTNDTGAYSAPAGSGPPRCGGTMGYGVGVGGYGNMLLPCQAFITVHRGAGSGIPVVGGYGNVVEGYGVGYTEYAGPHVEQTGITNTMIYQIINQTKPTGTTSWVAITN